MLDDLTNSEPIFVVGMNGSGTTMLLDCLDSHPELYGFRRETKVIPYFIASLETYGDLSVDKNFRRLWDDFRSIPDFRHVNKGVTPPLPENWRDSPRNLAAVIDHFFQYFAASTVKSRWCEKTPMHALHIVELGSLFSRAKFIHIIRDGRACAASFHRRWGHTPELTIFRWKHVVREAQRQGNLVESRYFELKYEDLTRDPDMWMMKICNFLSIPFHEEILKPSRSRPVTTGSEELQIIVKEDIWRMYFSDKKLLGLEDIAGSTLDDLGYETNNSTGDKEPNRLMRRFWLCKDYLRLGIAEFRNILLGRGKKSWRFFFEKIIRSIRQRTTTKY